jgi:phosphohistidine phosphatase SixA
MKKHFLMFVSVALMFTLLVACEKQAPASYESEIYLVRHFQKQSPPAGSSKDVNLTDVGQTNAILLAKHLKSKQIQTIYSTSFNRTKQTAAPSSEAFGLRPIMYDPQLLKAFSAKLLAANDNQLVVGHSNTTGILFGLLGCDTAVLREQDYGDIFVVKRLHTQNQTTLSACETYKLAENIYDVSQLILVKQSELSDYWVQSNVKFSFEPSYATIKAIQVDNKFSAYPHQGGIVEVGFIIDANGNTSHFEILKSQPAGLWHTQALVAAKTLRFSLTEGQKRPAKPIYTTWVFAFKAV